MAIKGKKKSQSRGSQGQRRPAMAPRPVSGGRSQKPPWYKTTAGQAIAAISALIAIVVVLALVNNARTERQAAEQAQSSLEDYTGQVRSLLQTVTPPASEMTAVATAVPEDLAGEAKKWSETFTGAQAQVAQLIPPEGAGASSDLLGQSIQLFAGAANTFALAAELEGQQQADLLSSAGSQLAAASGVWDAAVTVLDEARDENDLSPSGIRSPTAAPPSGAPTPDSPTATVPVEPEEEGGGGKRGRDDKGDDADE